MNYHPKQYASKGLALNNFDSASKESKSVDTDKYLTEINKNSFKGADTLVSSCKKPATGKPDSLFKSCLIRVST